MPSTRVVLPDANVRDIGDLVKVDGQKAVLAGVDDASGRAIVRFPEREGWAAKAIPAEGLSDLKPVEIHGKSYLVSQDGTVFSQFDAGEGNMLLPNHEYRLTTNASGLDNVSPEASLAKLDQTDAGFVESRVLDMSPGNGVDAKPVETFSSAAEKDLSKGRLTLDGEVHPESRRTEVYPGKIETADGRHIDVVFHNPEHTVQAQAERLRNERAGHELSNIIGFESKYPATVERTSTINGNSVDGWVQESSGSSERLQDHLRHRTVERFGRVDGFDEDLPRLLKEDPALKSRLEEAIVERMVYGDHDINLHNIAMSEDGTIRNLDLGEAFKTNPTAELSTFRHSLLDTGLHKSFAGEEISEPLRQKLSAFAKQYEDVASQSELASRLNLSEEQVSAVVSRARQLAETGKFPDIDPNMVDADSLDFWRAGARSEAEHRGLIAREIPAKLDVVESSNGVKLSLESDSGRLKVIDSEHGGRVEIGRAPDGNLRQVDYVNGPKYTTEDGINWHVEDKTAPDGGYDIRGKLDVADDGKISWHPEGGSLSVRHPDGSMVLHDAQGQVERIMSGNGRMSYVKHSPLGEVSEVTYPSGIRYSTEDGVNWHVIDRTVPNGGYDVKGKMAVSQDGDIRWHPDGGDTSVMHADGSGLSLDRTTGRISDIIDIDDIKTHLDYDANDQIRKVTYPNGIVYSSVDGESWRVIDATAPDGGYDVRGRMSLTQDHRLDWQSERIDPQEALARAEQDLLERSAARQRPKSLEQMLRDSDDGTFRHSSYDGNSGAQFDIETGSGRIHAVDSQRGGRVEIGYAEFGGVNEVTHPNGVRFNSDDGINWRVLDDSHPDGGYNVRGSMAISEDGKLTWHPEGGDRQVRNPDGAILRYDRHSGSLSEIISPEGAKLRLVRGSEGRLHEVSYPNGIVYKSLDGDTWHVTDKTAPGGGYDIKGSMTVSEDGKLSWRPEHGDTTVRHPDGSIVLKEGDGGKVTEIISPAGNKTRLAHDTNNEIREVIYPSGVTYRSLDGENWRVIDASHPDGGYNVRGRMAVDNDGTLAWQPENGRLQTRRPDGTVHIAELESVSFAEGSFDQLTDKNGRRRLWGPQRDVQKMSSDERMQLFQEIETIRSPLNQSDMADKFVETALPPIEQWRDLTPLLKPYEAAKDRYTTAVNAWTELRDTKLELGSEPFRNTDAARELFKGSPEDLKILDEYLNARQSRELFSEHVEKHMTVRRDELQMALDQYADANDLPHVEIKLRENEHMGSAKASYGAGEITLNKNDLTKRDTGASLLGSLYHEFTHAEQDNTILRGLADELGVKADYDAADIDAVMASYKAKTNRPADRDFVNRVMHKRSTLEDVHLSEADRARLPELIEAYRKNAPVGQAWIESGNDFRVTNGAIKALDSDDPNAGIKLLSKINRDDGTARAYNRRLFGADAPPQELVDFYKNFKKFHNGDDDAWNPQISREARTRFREILSDRLESINDSRQLAYDHYMQLHEKDALIAGEWARLAAVRRGAGDSELVAIDGVKWRDTDSEIEQLLKQLDERSQHSPNRMDSIGSTGDDVFVGGADDTRIVRSWLKQPGETVEQARARSIKTLGDSSFEINNYNKLNEPGQANLQRTMDRMLKDMKQNGDIGPDWQVYPTAKDSPADLAGADFLLVNQKTGDFHILDATANPEKFANPGQHNVPHIRQKGLIFFENNWFDEIGSIKVDDTRVGVDAQEFQTRLREQLAELTREPSPFRLGETPLPDPRQSLTPEGNRAQIDQFSTWIRQEALRTDDYSMQVQLDEYAGVLERGASEHLRFKAREVAPPPVLKNKIGDTTDRTVIDYLIERTFRGNQTNSGPARSNVYLHKDGHLKLDIGERGLFDAGPIETLLSDSRTRLFNDENLRKALGEKKLARLAKNNNITEKEVLDRLKRGLTDHRGEIENIVANQENGIRDRLTRRLGSMTEESLFGETPKPKPGKPIKPEA
ncbi:MAG: hypothetical protein K8F91_23450, partial [Candidatus Obscuribacterales bacterium]|nr:hypothetical protein [Candidatus Obscuribacterales bacterium]